MNENSETNLSHWGQTLPVLLKAALADPGTVRVADRSSVDYAFRELHLNTTDHLTEEQVRSVAQVIEVQKAVWGEFAHREGKWILNVRLTPATKAATKTLAFASSDMADALTQAVQGILPDVTSPTRSPLAVPLTCRLSHYPDALEAFSQSCALIARGGALPDAVTYLRRAVQIDPKFAMGLATLARYLVAENERAPALAAAQAGVAACPMDPVTHVSLGEAYLLEGRNDLARTEFREAIRLNNDNSYAYLRLAETFLVEQRYNEGIDALNSALQAAPHDAIAHAMLGTAYAKLGEENKARKELRLADRYDSHSDPGAQQSMALAYRDLNDFPQAAEHFAALLEMATKRGFNSQQLAEIAAALAEVQIRLKPHFIPPPTGLRSEFGEVADRVTVSLPSGDTIKIRNPIVISPPTRKRALDIVARAKTDEEKAILLFRALTAKTPGGEPRAETGPRTSNTLWQAGHLLTCQDYTLSYIGQARAAGLRSFYVLVNKDYLGRPVLHACAAVVLDSSAILADTTYSWFGAPHTQYEVESDTRMAALVLAQSNQTSEEEDALSLVPDWPLPRFLVGIARINRGSCSAARAAISTGLELESRSWLALYTRGMLDICADDWTLAATHFTQCLSLNPEWPAAHFSLGATLGHQGKLSEARAQYRAYLRAATDSDTTHRAREALAYIDQVLPE